ncbi:MAG: 1-acyl-sn-glycerol-3-phosphate acyltransferase [Bacteroidales bacterium]|nr:1-acyl-sn-glycerol-3-phosphate acyltransferase [Bacteroidales bacterium]
MKYIDIKEIISERYSKLLKRIPRPLLYILKIIIRENKINKVLNKYSDSLGAEFLGQLQKEMKLKTIVLGQSNLPEIGRCIFVANHPMGVMDGLILTGIISNKYGEIKAIGNDVFGYIPQLQPLLAKVNVFEGNNRDYLKNVKEIYSSESAITHFPAGLVSRIENYKIKDGVWQKSFISKSIECKRDVVPIFISGRNSILFYLIYIVRSAFKFNLNIELILLPYEFFRKKNKTIKVVIGTPISYKDLTKDQTHNEWAQQIKEKVYSMKN